MLPDVARYAFKEWAVTIAALARGEQILLMRKGGIREDGKHFKVEQERFFLYPTFDHQKSELIKPEFKELFNESLKDEDPDLVTLSNFAEVEAVFDTADEHAVNSLQRFHVWTPDYATKRLRWKPRFPLKVMLLRVYELEQPQALPVMPEYNGCKSWVQLVEDFPVGAARPVLNDRRFNRKVEEIKAALGESADIAHISN